MQAVVRTGLAAVLLVTGGNGFADGERAYREGRFADAVATFAAEVAERGDRAPAELHYDLALAALAAGDLRLANDAIDRAAAATAAVDLVRRCAFVRGSIAWQRGEAAAKLALQVEAEPFAFTPALQQLESAREQWQMAATAEPDWPEARRNVERAVRRLADLREQKQKLEEQRRRAAGAQERPMLVPGGDDAQRDGAAGGGNVTATADHPLAPLRTELSAQAVAELFARLEQKEQQKLKLRREQRDGARTAVERDW